MATQQVRPVSPLGAFEEAAPEHLTRDDRVALLRYMLLMRSIEERAMNLYRQGKVPGSFYDGFGQEAVSAGAAFAMAAEDRLCILHRDLAAHLVRGVEPGAGARAVHGPRRRLHRPGATATSTSATARSAASGWSRCCPT